MKLIEQERGRPFGAMLGMLAKREISEKEYLKQFLMETWGADTNIHQRTTQRKSRVDEGEKIKRVKIREKEQEKWACPICEEENPSDEDVCKGCGSLKEEPSYDQIADEMDEED